MPLFQYQGVNTQGKMVTGVMLAPDESSLEHKLELVGCWLVNAEPAKADATPEAQRAGRPRWMDGWGKIPRRDMIEFCTLIGFQTKVGIPLIQALEVASQDCDNPRFQRILDGVRHDMEAGALFHEALAKYPGVFSPQLVSVVKAGELSSKLPDTFADLRSYLEWVEQVIGDVRQASIYPAVVLTVISAFVLLLFSYVIPKFVMLLESTKAPLPLITQVVFGVSDFAKATWWMWLILLLLLTVGTKVLRHFSKGFGVWFDGLKLKLPVFGELNLMLSISRFTHNLALLYKSGIPIVPALHLCEKLVGNAVVEKAVADVAEKVAAGQVISAAMRQQPVFPSMLLRMVIMGENTGNLDLGLENISAYYTDIIPRRIKKIFSLLEPSLILFLVVLVGAIALSIFLPILSLMNAIK